MDLGNYFLHPQIFRSQSMTESRHTLLSSQ